MENVRDGIGRYVRSLQHPKDNGGVIGAAVMNCNPFTNGHRYLVETAASQCELLHLFVRRQSHAVPLMPSNQHVRHRLRLQLQLRQSR